MALVHWLIVQELAVDIGSILQKLHAVVGVADLNDVPLNGGMICRHLCMYVFNDLEGTDWQKDDIEEKIE